MFINPISQGKLGCTIPRCSSKATTLVVKSNLGLILGTKSETFENNEAQRKVGYL